MSTKMLNPSGFGLPPGLRRALRESVDERLIMPARRIVPTGAETPDHGQSAPALLFGAPPRRFLCEQEIHRPSHQLGLGHAPLSSQIPQQTILLFGQLYLGS